MYNTSYNAACKPVETGVHLPAEQMPNKSFVSSIEMGGGRFFGKTQFQSSFTPKDP